MDPVVVGIDELLEVLIRQDLRWTVPTPTGDGGVAIHRALFVGGAGAVDFPVFAHRHNDPRNLQPSARAWPINLADILGGIIRKIDFFVRPSEDCWYPYPESQELFSNRCGPLY